MEIFGMNFILCMSEIVLFASHKIFSKIILNLMDNIDGEMHLEIYLSLY